MCHYNLQRSVIEDGTVGNRYPRPFPKFAIDLFPSRASEALRPEQLTNFRVSNILRMIGAYLDAGEHELVEIQKRPISITLPA